MEPSHDTLRSRAPAASSALLSAALGGLLSLTASCAPRAEQPAPEAGASADTASSPEASAPIEASTGADTSAATDASAPADARPADASATADASAPFDAAAADVVRAADAITAPDTSATPDASATADTSADAPLDAASEATVADASRGPDEGCDVVPDRVVTYSDAGMGLTLATFTARCNTLGGFIEIHPHCGGANTCGGFSYDETVGIYTEHSCAGLNTCTGYTCVLTRR